ncbi:copper resistance protein B, partial [Pseudomonas sp.]|uniref:copper resistance protein B n=1 Tax=Pseudomonas sp. TaxID=306 RepID=UPI00390CD454
MSHLIGSKNTLAGALAVMLGAAQIPVALAAEAQMQGMDHSQMQGMDHSQMQAMGQEKVTQSRTPIPELTDADRAAVFIDSDGHAVHDKALNTFFLLDQLEWQDADEGSALSWDAQGWIGGDIDRLWIRSEGERTNGKTEEAEVQVLW